MYKRQVNARVFDGTKGNESGMGGSRMGPAGYLRFFRKKALIHQTGAPATIDSICEQHARPAS